MSKFSKFSQNCGLNPSIAAPEFVLLIAVGVLAKLAL